MDGDQHELQLLGFLGVYRETSKIILKWRKIFAQITVALILPLCVIFLAHYGVSQVLSYKILSHENDRDYTLENSPKYRNLSRMLKEWVAFWLVKLGYFVFVFIFSLLSTSAVVYTVACVYAAKQITFKKIMSVVPRVWKRLMVTFLWSFATFVAFVVVAFALLIAITLFQFFFNQSNIVPNVVSYNRFGGSEPPVPNPVRNQRFQRWNRNPPVSAGSGSEPPNRSTVRNRRSTGRFRAGSGSAVRFGHL